MTDRAKDQVSQRLSALTPQQREALLRRLKAKRAVTPASDLPQIPRLSHTRYRASFAQERLWFLHRLDPQGAAYNGSTALLLNGALDIEVLRRSLSTIVERHEVLRSTFEDDGGELFQRPAPAQPFPLDIVDLTAVARASQTERAKAALFEHASRSFDLGKGPLFRGCLARLSHTEHVLLLTAHHIVSDGWSVDPLVNELSLLYRAGVSGQAASLPELPIQYGDYAEWEHTRWERGECDSHLTYWRERLSGAPALCLPLDRPRATKVSTMGGADRVVLSEALSTAVRTVARDARSTVFMTLFAAFTMLVHRYTGSNDIVIASPIANRPHRQLERLIGFFSNLVPLRTRMRPDATFEGILAQVRDVALAAHEHQEVPFTKLVEELSPARDGGHSPFAHIVFAARTDGFEDLQLPGLTVSAFAIEEQSTRFDLELHSCDRADGIELRVCYSTDLFEHATMQRLLTHFVNVLEQVLKEPHTRADEIAVLSRPERAALLDRSRREAVPQSGRCVHLLFDEQARQRPEAIAVVHGDREITYGELACRANRLAHRLRRAGVGPEHVVPVVLEPSVEFVAAALGIMKSGAAYLPLDPYSPVPRVVQMVRDSRAAAVVTRTDMARNFVGVAAPICVDAPEEEPAKAVDPPAIVIHPDNLAYVIYTSGSTGSPKGVEITHAGLSNLVQWHLRVYEVSAEDRATQIASVGFDACVWELWPYLAAGARVCIADRETRLSPPALARWLRREQVSVSFMPTPLAEGFLREPLDNDLPLRLLLTGGDRLIAAPKSRTGFQFVNHYGPTENSVVSTAGTVGPEASGSLPPPIGWPIDNVECFVLDRSFNLVPDGIEGELYLGGASLARGYLHRASETAEHFVPDPFGAGTRLYRTGDLVRRLPDGQLSFVGRRDNQVKIRGFRIELGEIESALAAVPGVSLAAAAVHGAGEAAAVVGYVAPLPDATLRGLDVRAHLQGVLPAYMVPAAVVVLDSMPLTSNGKVDRTALPAPEATDHRTYVAPRSVRERQIAEIWREVLEVEQVGTRDNFFDVGGHSLRLLRVHSKIESLLNRPIPLVTLFEYPTIEGLAAHLWETADEHAALVVESSQEREPIAVIGMAGRFPGAPDVEHFWANVRDGVESVHRFTRDELIAAGVPGALVDHPRYVPVRGAIAGADLFDAALFGYTPREAAALDPQQRLLLECAWEALERAGYPPRGNQRYRVGVYAGASSNGYTSIPVGHAAGADAADTFESMIAGTLDYVATRVSYKLRLTGPSFTIQTACSTSLVAVHVACQAIQSGECELALAGGVSVGMPLVGGYVYEPDGKESPDGHTRTFDARGAGTILADGVGLVVLKRLSAALADGDVIHAVIRGTAINNDGGDKVGFTAPSIGGQAAVIAAAQAAAQVDPNTITYVEAHGTATTLGDPIEVAALRRVFGDGAGPATCGLGSVKTNFGHMNTAAGVAGLIKAVLALSHRELPPSLHFERANPHIDLGPFYVPTELRPWTVPDGAPRRAGVSSFGIGGTNAHVVLEEAPGAMPPEPGRSMQVVPISAQTREAARQAANRLADHLAVHSDVPLADVAYTQQIGRAAMTARCVAVGRDAATIATGLARAAVHVIPSSAERPVVWMFSGHGTQAPEMGRALYESEPAFRVEIDACAEALRGVLDGDLREVLYPDAARRAAAARRLAEWTWSQVALVAVELASAAMWRAWGVKPAAIIGHSIGEVAAACAAGVLTREGALRVAAMRGQLMEAAPRGGMLAVGLSAGEVASRLTPELWLAGVNGPNQCVISGHESAIEELHARLAAEGHLTHRIAAERAGHSGLMSAVSTPLVECAARQSMTAPRVPWFSTAIGAVMTAADAVDPGYWGRQVTATVQWHSAVEAIRASLTTPPIWLELGPGHTLAHLVRGGIVTGETALATIDGPDEESTTNALAELWARGGAVDWHAYHAGARRQRVLLPTYPFEHQRYWRDQPAAAAVTAGGAALAKNPDVAQWFYTPGWVRTPLDAGVSVPPSFRPVVLVDTASNGEQIISTFAANGHTPVRVTAAETFERRGPCDYAIDPLERGHYTQLVAHLEADGTPVTHILQCWDITPATTGGSPLPLPPTAPFLRTLYLAQALDASSAKGVQLVVATSDAYDVTGNEPLQPAHATIGGLCRVIAQEYPRVLCRCVDVSVDAASVGRRTAEQLALELTADTRDILVAYRHGHRLTARYTPRSLPAVTARPALLREQGVYLITGGLGRIGLVLAEYLAGAVHARLVLIGRHDVPPREMWDTVLDAGDSGGAGEIIGRLRRIEALGGEVLTVSADVAEPGRMRAAIELAERSFGALHGVIHAAAVTAGSTFAPLASLDAATVEEHFTPKVAGAVVLGEVLAGTPLDFCVLTSSLSTLLGGLNFGAYAAANAFLDSFAAMQARTTGVPWMSIVWDGWQFGDLEPLRGSTAELATTPAEGAEVFARLLHGRPMPCTVISTVDLDRRMNQWSIGAPDRPEPERAGTAMTQSRELETAYLPARTETERVMTTIWAELIGVDRVGVDDDFFGLGGHSLLGTRVMSRVRERFGVDLSLHALFASPTVAGLSTRVDERRAQQAPRGKAARAATQLKVLSRTERERLLQQVRAARKAAE